MTIKVTISNNDSRENAVIEVSDTSNPSFKTVIPSQEWSTFHVHSGNSLIVTEKAEETK